MRFNWLTAAIVSLALEPPAAAAGQTTVEPEHLYIGGSVILSHLPAHQPRQTPFGSAEPEGDGVGSSGTGGAIFFGASLRRHLAIEADLAIAPGMRAHQARSMSGFVTNHRDRVISMLVGYRPAPKRRVAFEPAGGLSVAYGSTRLTDVEQFRTFCDGGTVRHCAVPAPDVALGSHAFWGFATAVQTALRMNGRSAAVVSARVDHWFDRNGPIGNVQRSYRLRLSSTMFRVSAGARIGLGK